MRPFLLGEGKLDKLSPQFIALIGICLATFGWIWSTKRARSLSRKQHTFNALLQASFNAQYQSAHSAVRPFVRGKKPFEWAAPKNQKLKDQFTFLLNHYEFLAAGVRRGDISESLLKDSQRGVIVSLYSYCEPYVESLRTDRHKQALFEHIEWLHMRWDENPPKFVQRVCESVISRPIYHQYYKWFFWAPVVLLAGMALEGVLIDCYARYVSTTPVPHP